MERLNQWLTNEQILEELNLAMSSGSYPSDFRRNEAIKTAIIAIQVQAKVKLNFAELEKEFKEKFVIKTKDKMGFDNYSYKQFRFADGIWVWIKEKLSNFSA